MTLQEGLDKCNIVTFPWTIDEKGVWREIQPKKKKKKQADDENDEKDAEDVANIELVCPIPLFPSALVENADSGIEKVEITFFKSGKWRSITVPRSVAADRGKILRLADEGIEVNSGSAALLVQYIASAVANTGDRMPRKAARSVMGWCDGEFMPYTDATTFDGDETYRYLYRAISSRGTLDEWAKYVAPLRSKLEVRLCMAAAFASPLVELVGENPFVFHLFGGTGTGKTVALLVAMSAFGNPALGKLTRTMNMTQNAMLSTAAFLCNLPFAGDELQTIKSAWGNYDLLIMRITEGVDRGRMTYDRINETKSWKCSFIFSGEEPCVKQSSGGGAKNRVIEVECKGRLIDKGNEVANFVRTHYGHAGREYVNSLDPDEVRELYSSIFSTVISSTDTTDKQAGAISLMLTADRLSSRLFWREEKPVSVEDVREYLFSANEVDVAERAYQTAVNLIAKNLPAFTDDSREVWGRMETQSNEVYVNKLVLEEQLEAKGFDFDAVKKKWRDKGYLIVNTQGKMFHHTVCFRAKGVYVRLKLPPEDAQTPLPDLPF